MAKFKFIGLDGYMDTLSRLSSAETVKAICGATIYAGADIVADAIRAGIDGLPVVDHRQKGSESSQLGGITSAQKKGLQEGFGISPMAEENGYYNVKLGFDGYNSVKTKKYPNGQPNSMIARSINSGTSFRAKIPFVDSAVKQNKKKAEQAMKEKSDEEIRKVMEGD